MDAVVVALTALWAMVVEHWVMLTALVTGWLSHQVVWLKLKAWWTSKVS